jgi:Flp pilus assembly protein TadD
VLAPLVLGALAVTNSWDFPTYGLLLGAAVVGAAWRRGAGVAELLRAALLAAGLGVAAMALYTPFFDTFYAMVSGVGAVDVLQDGTGIRNYLLLYGLFLAVLLPFVFGTLWRLVNDTRVFVPWVVWVLTPVLFVLLPVALVLLAWRLPVAGLLGWLAALLLLGGGLLLWRRLDPAAWFVLLLALLAWAVSLGVELLFIRDHLAGGDAYRMNTVFKFGLHIWTLLALAAAAALPWVLRGLGRLSQRRGWSRAVLQAPALLLLGVLVAMAAVYPLAGTPSRIANRFPVSLGPTLDGLAFLQQAEFGYNCAAWGGCAPGVEQVTIDLEADAAAIAWLNEEIAGTPIVLQSNLWFYRAYGIRVAANTGLPTVISALHTNEQRDPALTLQRNNDVERLFRITDTETTLRLLAEYNVDYIYVGPVERAVYGAAGLNKFDSMAGTYLDVVYDEPGARIYQVTGIPPNYAQPEPFRFANERSGPAEPVVSPDDAPQPMQEVAPGTSELAEQMANEPENAQLAYGLALEYRAANRLEEAERVLRLAAAHNREDVGLHHLWGDILMQMGNYEEAEYVYRKIARTVPTAGNWNKLGWSLLQWDQTQRAEEAFMQAIEIDDNEPAPYFYLGQMHMERGSQRQAIDELERYLRLAPEGQFVDEARRMLAEMRASETDEGGG